ncbi:MAG: hypothetical protein ACRKGH_02020 [Dehalogenimonas sp.]
MIQGILSILVVVPTITILAEQASAGDEFARLILVTITGGVLYFFGLRKKEEIK